MSKRKLQRQRSASLESSSRSSRSGLHVNKSHFPEIEITEHFTKTTPAVADTSPRHSLPSVNVSNQLKLKSHKHTKNLSTHSLDRSHIHHSIYAVDNISHYNEDFSDETFIIKVHINLSQYRLGIPYNICSLESIGIIPNRYSVTGSSSLFRRQSKGANKHSLPVIIRGVIPASPAALTEQFKPGDEIIQVNGQPVTMGNIEEIIAQLSKEVIFDVNKYLSHISPTHACSPPPRDISSPSPSPSHFTPPPPPPLLLYLTLDTKEEDPPEKDIIYTHPRIKEVPILDKLIQLRGVFLTLSDLVYTFSMSHYTNYSIVVDGQLFHTAGHLIGKQLLVVTLLSSSAMLSQVEVVLKNIEDCLLLLFGDLSSAFKDENGSTLDSVLDSLLMSPLLSPDSFLPLMLKQLPISVKTMAQLSYHLNHLDAASYRTGSLSLLSPLGSCLFYKGYLVCHHLSDNLLHGVLLLSHCHQLLELTSDRPLSELTILWKQIYFPNYEKLFVLIMGMEHTLLCLVTQVTSDNDQLPDDRCKENARAVLEEVHASGLLSECERRISLKLPALTSADILLASKLTSSLTSKNRMTRSSTGSIYSISTIASGGSLSDSDTEPSALPVLKKSSALFRSFRLRRHKNKSAQSTADTRTSVLPSATREAYLLTAGMENHLLHYILLQSGRGILLSPCESHMREQPVHSQLLKCFKDTASYLHNILHQKKHEEDIDWEDENNHNEDTETRPDNKPFSVCGSPIIEHGVLLSCTTLTTPTDGLRTSGRLKTPPILDYWVIGRLFEKEKRELYVCYQENMSQTSVEMAFKLLFGATI